MLNIPAEVKTLFKSDSVFKNFHVNFPNGEHTDLNNDDVISESVSFTESICSKDVFQFGLSERPQIEFECVNVPNIYGVTIYCAIEICVDSLGAQWISDHQPVGRRNGLIRRYAHTEHGTCTASHTVHLLFNPVRDRTVQCGAEGLRHTEKHRRI